jgi:hypothetical protein
MVFWEKKKWPSFCCMPRRHGTEKHIHPPVRASSPGPSRVYLSRVYSKLKRKKSARCNLVNGRSKRSRKNVIFLIHSSVRCCAFRAAISLVVGDSRKKKRIQEYIRRRVKLARQTDETGSSLILPESSRHRLWFGEREEDDYKTFTRRHFTLQLIRNAKRYFSLMDTLHI